MDVISMFGEIEILRRKGRLPDYELKLYNTISFYDSNGMPLDDFSDEDKEKIKAIHCRMYPERHNNGRSHI